MPALAHSRSADVHHAVATLLGRCGVIHELRPLRLEAGDPRVHAFEGVPARAVLVAGRDVAGGVGGVGLTEDEALICAIGECVERYATAVYDADALPFASEAELGDAAVGVAAFQLFSPRQYAHPEFPFAQPRADVPMHWARARRLSDGAPRLVPASLVYLPWRPLDPSSDLHFLSVSTGQACHPDGARATLTGLYEVIERDAYMLTWLRRLPLPRVDPRTDPAVAAIVDAALGGTELVLHVFDMTLDTRVPAYLCYADGPSPHGRVIGTGAAARLDARAALVKAVLESVHTWLYARDILERRPGYQPAPDYADVREFEDHVRLFCNPEMREHLGFLLDGDARAAPRDDRPPATAEGELAEVLARLAAVGLEAYEVDVAPADVAACGYRVVKVLIPGAVPLTAIHAIPSVGSARLDSVPRALGWDAALAAPLSSIPHSFP
jgi:ribosomal protein S12 methylthiotransferase accessory factor